MKQKVQKKEVVTGDPLTQEVYDYLNKFDFALAYLIQKKFKIGFSRAEKILSEIEAKKKTI